MFAASARPTWPTLSRALLSSKPVEHCLDPVEDTFAKYQVRRRLPQSPISLAGPYAHIALSRILRFSDISMKDIGGGIDIYRFAFARHHLLPWDSWDPWLSLADEP